MENKTVAQTELEKLIEKEADKMVEKERIKLMESLKGNRLATLLTLDVGETVLSLVSANGYTHADLFSCYTDNLNRHTNFEEAKQKLKEMYTKELSSTILNNLSDIRYLLEKSHD